MKVTIEIETVADAHTIIEVLTAAKIKHEEFAANVQIESKPEDIGLWQQSIKSIEMLNGVIYKISKAIR